MQGRRSPMMFAGATRAGVCAVAILAAGLLGACSENPVGRKCFIGSDAGAGGTQSIIASPALECQSRTCLRVPVQKQLPVDPATGQQTVYSDQCTAECSSSDDCDRVPESPCVTGFTCAIPVVVGPFCCRKMCICKDYLVIPDGGLPAPAACEASNPDNQCCNLPGRGNLPHCQ